MVHLVLSENLCHQYLKKKLDFDFTFITRKNSGFPVFPRLTLTITTADGPSTGMKKKVQVRLCGGGVAGTIVDLSIFPSYISCHIITYCVSSTPELFVFSTYKHEMK